MLRTAENLTAPTVPSPAVADSIATLLAEPLVLDTLELLEVVVPQVESFRSALGVRNERRALIVRLRERDGAWGVGECSCRPDPWFNGEFVDGARAVLQDFVAPRLTAEGTVGDLVRVVERVRAWPFTRAALLDAVTDLIRRRGGSDLLDRWTGDRVERVPVGISLGLFTEPAAAVERVAKAVEAGYARVKLKVSPAMQVDTVVAIRDAFPKLHLGFDANGSLGESDFPLLERLAGLEPAVVEQPFAPDRLDLSRQLVARRLGFLVCLDESVASLGQLQSALALEALDELNLKPGRVGGPIETLKILDLCHQRGLPVWVGGMFETGIGRFANLRVARRLPDAHAHDLSPSRRYFSVDLVRHPLTMDSAGTIDLGDETPPALDDAVLTSLTTDHQTHSFGLPTVQA